MSETRHDDAAALVPGPVRGGALEGPSSPPESAKALTPGFLWYVARKWWALAAPLGLVLGVGAAGLLWYLFEPTYQAEAWVRIRPYRPIILKSLPQEDAGQFVENQIQILRSPPVLNQVLAKPEVARIPEVRSEEDPKQWLGERLSVGAVGRSEIYRVQFESSQPAHAAQILSSVLEVYLAMYDSRMQEQTSGLIDLLIDEKNHQIQKANTLQGEVLRLTKEAATDEYQLLNPFGRSTMISPRVEALHRELIRSQVERDILDAQVNGDADSPAESGLSQAELEREIAADPLVRHFQRQIAANEAALSAFQPDSPLLKQVKSDIAELQTQLEEVRAELATELPKLRAEKQGRIAALERSAAQRELAESEARQNALLAQLQNEQQLIEDKTSKRLLREEKLAELERTQTVIENIEDRIFWLNVELRPQKRPERVETLHPPEVPKQPVVAGPHKTMALALLMGLAVPFGLCVGWEMLGRRLYEPRQLEDHVRLPVVAEVAALPTRPWMGGRRSARRYARERAIYEESVESLRSALTLSEELKDVQALVVTSAVPGEGKSSLASQLALSCAQRGGEKVLLIDGDLRSPDVQYLFDVDPEAPGLAEALSGARSASEAIVDWGDSLHVLPAGRLRSSPHRLFANGAFTELLAELRGQYTRIIIDAPPVLSASESLKMAREADGVLYSALKEVSRAAQVKMAFERLAMVGARPVGVVFNGAPSSHYAYRYGAYA